jgi:hypothetical protein
MLILNKLTPWNSVLLELPSVAQLLKNFPNFFGTRKFITLFTRALHWSLFWSRLIQSIPPHFPYLRSVTYGLVFLVVSSLPAFPPKIPYTFFFVPMRATCHAHTIILDLMTNNIWWPPLWSSNQSSWLQIQRSGFDSRRYQIFWEVVGLERGPLILVSTIEELLGRKNSGSGLAETYIPTNLCGISLFC